MIARTWRGVTRAEQADEYGRYMERTGLASLRATPGNLAVFCLRRVGAEQAEFLVWSLWESEEAVRAFAGEDIARAVFFPDDPDYLIDKDEHVDHYQVVYSDTDTDSARGPHERTS